MLFQQLYNWIKYKTLPPSFLFKNRLFIERDSKSRRIFSNFGLNYRNSKWSNYSTYNVKTKFKTIYSKYLLIAGFISFTVLLLIYSQNYYTSSYLANYASFLFWVSVDAFDYYSSFLVWISIIFTSLILNLLHSFFFFNNFSKKTTIREIFSFKDFSHKKSFDVGYNETNQNLNIGKSDLNWILYSWLNTTNSDVNSQILTKLFENPINKYWWSENYDFFMKLYKLTFLSALFDKNETIKSLQNNFFVNNIFAEFTIYLNNDKSFNNTIKLLLWFDLTNNYSNFKNKIKQNNSLYNFKHRFVWNLYDLNNELDKHSFLLKTKIGGFYANNFNYEKFNYLIFNFQELWNLNFYVKNQLNAAKWNRWLYRYSILHRKILKNSHKLTIVKKTINSGFYDNNFFNKNIWNSEHFSKNNVNRGIFSAMSSLYYKDLYAIYSQKNFNSTNYFATNVLNQTKSLALLSFHENSYFWFLKRFYFFNTLPSNFINSKIKQKNFNIEINTLNFKNSSLSKYSIFSTYLLKSDINNFVTLNNEYFENIYPKNSIFKRNPDSYFLKDVYLLLDENDFFNKNNLNTFIWLTSNNSSTKKLKVFSFGLNYFFLNKPTIDRSPALNTFKANEPLNNLLFAALIGLNDTYRSDACYFTLFY